MTEGHEMRWGGMAGIGSVIFSIIAGLVMGSAPAITDPPIVIAAYLTEHRAQILAGSLLAAVAIVLFLWFGAALSTAFRRIEEASDAPAIVFGGFILVSAIGFLAMSVLAGMTYAITTRAILLPFAAGPYSAITVVGTVTGIAMALTLAATAAAIARTHVFPMWLAWFAGVVAILQALSSLTVAVTSGPLMPGGWLQSFVPGVLTGIWVLAASGLLVREHLPAITTPRTHPMGGPA